MRIIDISRIERPRERLVKYGAQKLSNEELLAIIFRSGKKGENVLQLAKRFIRKYKNTDLSQLDFKELHNNFDLGSVKTCQLLAAIELGKRLMIVGQSKSILNPKDIWEELREIRKAKKEFFIAYYLNINNEVIKKETISVGSLNASLVHPREVFEPAVKYLASQIILVHNHQSGVSEPSEEDLKLTKRLVEAGKIMGIEIIDHVILTEKNYLSFKEKKIL